MKHATITGIIAAAVLIAGCSKKSASGSSPTPPAVAASSLPAAQSALTAWQNGEKEAAVGNFLAADWSARPLFAEGSTLNLSEAEFKALSDADREIKSGDVFSQLDSLKQLAQAITQAGHDAASKGDVEQARKYFTSLKQCGTSLAGPDRMQLVQLVGKAFVKMSDTGLSKIGQ